MSTVHSADGTPIAFDVQGEGQPLILVDGATSHRAVNPLNAEVGKLLSEAVPGLRLRPPGARRER